MESNSRRQYLKSLAWLLTSGASGYFAKEVFLDMQEAAAYDLKGKGRAKPSSTHHKATRADYKIADWKGDNFSLGHRLRNHELPAFPKKAEKYVDFVIIGGGIGGLTSAYYLKDHDFLLLEQYDDLGGQSRGANYHGIGYSYGAAYMGEVDGLTGDLLTDLNLQPVKFEEKKLSWRWGKTFIPGVTGAEDNDLYKEFARLLNDLKPIWDRLPKGDDAVDLANADMDKLDSTPFSAYFKNYSPQFTTLIDGFLKSLACGGINNLSALTAAANLTDLVEPSYVFPGGNPALAQGLIEKLTAGGSRRCRTGCFVWSVEIKDGRASIVYTSRDGAPHRVDCRHVIISAPPLVSARLLTNASDMLKAQLLWYRYGSYLVANLLLKKQLFKEPYDTFYGAPFDFADVVVAESPYMVNGTYKPEMGSVLTVYQPYAPGSAGRPILLVGDRQLLATQIISQLSSVEHALEKNLESVVMSRWGHAMAVTVPGYYQRTGKLKSMAGPSLSFAHCSVEGLPCAESAIKAARLAADSALKLKRKCEAGVFPMS